MKLQGIAIFKDELSDSNTADGRFDEISGEQWPPPVNGMSCCCRPKTDHVSG